MNHILPTTIRLALISIASYSAIAAASNVLPPATPADIAAILPPEQVVRKTLENLPQLRSGTLNKELAQASKQRLEAGSHEWLMRVSQARRTEQSGDSLRDQEIAIERPVRWFGKASKDAAIGDKTVDMAQLSYADSWHEAGRSLLNDWFDTLRAVAYRQRLQEQADITGQLRSMAEKRVKAGDAARLELMLADTEAKRVEAQLQQAQLREEQQKQALATLYSGLQIVELQQLPAPLKTEQSHSYWVDQIMDDNHELELAEAEAALSKLQASRIAAERMPDPTVGIRAARERSGQERIYGISISIPLSGTARKADASAAALKSKMAEEKYQFTRLKVTREAQRVVSESQKQYTIWQTMHAVQQQSQAQATTALAAYKLGEVSLSDTLQIRRNAIDATLAAEAAQIDALFAHARLELDAHKLWVID